MYSCSRKYESANQGKVGVLITNLGTPDSPTKESLKVYLKEFLSDPRVVEPPPARWLWKLILNLIILNTRPKKSAEAYQSVWGKFGDGSPLLDIGKEQKRLISKELNDKYTGQFEVEIGMRYGNPSIASGLKSLEEKGCEKVLIFPLYPQYASATTGSTFDAVADALKTMRRVPELKFVSHYYNDKRFIKALSNSVKKFQKQHGKPDLLLTSYHGIPKRYFENGDNYPCHCCKTTYLLAKDLKLEPSQYKMSFQSLFGKEEWMRDYTDETLKSLPSKGVKNVQVICPGFSADCLETIEEIDEENREYFMEAGGETYHYIPALNYDKEHISCLTGIIIDKTKDWMIK